MTRLEWQALRPGDQVRFYYPDRTYVVRTLLPSKLYFDPNRIHRSHYFPIRHKSWTKRIYTVIGENDVFYPTRASWVEFHGRTKKLMSDEEVLRLVDCGFSIRKRLDRELVEQQGLWHGLEGRIYQQIDEVCQFAELLTAV